MTSVELRQQYAQLWERAKQMNDSAEAENRDFTAEERTNWDAVNADMARMDERIKRQEALERTPAPASEQRKIEIATPQATKAGRDSDEYRDAFATYLIHGREGLDLSERRLLSGHTDTLTAPELRAIGAYNQVGAGYLVPVEFERRIRQNMLAFGGMREASTVMSTNSGADLDMPTSDDTGNTGELLAEHATASEQDVTTGIKVLKAFKYSSKVVRVSLELLQDSAFDIQSWLSGLLAERLARIQNTHFTIGDGGNQPLGITRAAGTGITGAAGTATSVLWDDLIRLEHTVDPAYRAGARYMFHDSTLSQLRRAKDGDGNYIWQAGTQTGIPATVNGWPYTINQDMPVFAANAISILFGQLKNYIIRDVMGVSIIRLDELYALQGQVAFIGFNRCDGLLVHAGTNPVQAYVNGAT